MSKEKFTPGMWGVDIEHHGIHITPNIAWLGEKSSMEREENIANAYLIAAAPEMYKELSRQCVICKLKDHETECDFCRIGKVLKTARGEK